MSDHAVDTATLVRRAAEAGASPAFLATLVVDYDGRHLPRQKAMQAPVAQGERPMMGGFASHLWDGEVRAAWLRADHDNSQIMRKAGLSDE
jgi:hypothetical protein